MKTRMTYIAILSLLTSFSSAFAQNADERINNDSNYDAIRVADLNKITNTTQDEESTNMNRAPQGRMAAADMINYQAVARDGSGNLITNTPVTIDFDIHEGTAAGPVVFSETQNPTTDANGVFSVQIGSVVGLAVDWAADAHFLEVALNGTSVGTTEFVSVPYAKSADTMPFDARIGDNTVSSADVVTISGDNTIVGEIIDLRATNVVTANNDIMNLDMPAGSSADAQFIEARNGGAVQFQVQGDGRTLINATTTAPQLNTVYGNSIPIAFAKIDGSGNIDSGYGIASVVRESAGTYLITVNNSAAGTVDLIPIITPFTSGGATPEIPGFVEVSANSFRAFIRLQSDGSLTDSIFSILVFGNH
jgi:hypothetical protein